MFKNLGFTVFMNLQMSKQFFQLTAQNSSKLRILLLQNICNLFQSDSSI